MRVPRQADIQRMSQIFSQVELVGRRLDQMNGMSREQNLLQVIKLTEEVGEVSEAAIAFCGQNPRKLKRPVGAVKIIDELGDVAMAALVAIRAWGGDPLHVLHRTAKVKGDRLLDFDPNDEEL